MGSCVGDGVVGGVQNIEQILGMFAAGAAKVSQCRALKGGFCGCRWKGSGYWRRRWWTLEVWR